MLLLSSPPSDDLLRVMKQSHTQIPSFMQVACVTCCVEKVSGRACHDQSAVSAMKEESKSDDDHDIYFLFLGPGSWAINLC